MSQKPSPGTGVYPDVTIEQSHQEAIVLTLQRHHSSNLSHADFTRVFGVAPVEDSQRLVGLQMLSALIGATE